MALATGYLPRRENKAWLKEAASPFPFTSFEASQAPDEIDHRPWLQVENQGPVSSCVGHGDSSTLEVCNFYDTGGEVINLSRMYAYLTAQKASGLFGRDQGATISGALAANANDGICLEKTFPYPGKYVTRITKEAHDEASQHKLIRHTPMRTYEDCMAWLQTGQGGIVIGVRWVSSLINTTGVIESISGRSSGFHCMAILGYSQRKDSRGRKYLWMVNSHGKGWGNAGWAEVAPAVIAQWCKRTDWEELIGASDLQEYGTREVTTFDMI